jgi:hypothetical protein
MALADRFARRGRESAPAAVEPAPPGTAPPVDSSGPGTGIVPRQAVRDQLRDLLDRAGTQDAETARDEWLAKAVALLVPDEARILQVLAEHGDGDPGAALVHIHCLTGTGIAGEAVLENASLVGRAAGVAVPDLTPWYLTRLLQLDLVEIGPEDPRLDEDYRQLLGDASVLSALRRARIDGFTPRVLRHALRLAPLGRALWATVTP